MKRSHILFALSFVAAIAAAAYPEFIGNVKMTADNRPVNALSKMWLNFYDLKVSHPLPQSVKYLKVYGNKNRGTIFLNMEKADRNSLFSHMPQGRYAHEMDGDTLVLRVLRDFADVQLNLSGALERVSVQGGYLNIKQPIFSPTGVALLADKNGMLTTRLREAEPDSIAQVRIEVRNGSSVELPEAKMGSVSAYVAESSSLSYGKEVQVDSLFVTLKGKSNVYATDHQKVDPRIKTLVVSGDRQHFNKEFVGKGVEVVEKFSD